MHGAATLAPAVASAPGHPWMWHTFVDSASGRVCSVSTQKGSSSARACGAALQIRLDGSAGHRIVDPLQGGKVVSVLCVVCGSYGVRVVRRSLLSSCPGAPTPGTQLPCSKRTVRLVSVLGEVLLAQSGPCRTRPPFLAAAALLHVVIVGPAQARPLRQRRCAPAGAVMSRAAARAVSPAGSSAGEEICSDEVCFPSPTLQESCGSHCRRVSMNVHLQ